jgi:hypothetical protein
MTIARADEHAHRTSPTCEVSGTSRLHLRTAVKQAVHPHLSKSRMLQAFVITTKAVLMDAPKTTSPILPLFVSLVALIVSGSLAKVSAQITTISQVSGPFSLQRINGRKVVATSSGLHAVFSTAYDVKYAMSATGATWSAPVTITSAASHPTIAVAGTTIGIAYRGGTGMIYYRHKLSNGSWSTPIGIQSGDDPAMVGYGSSMYLTWMSGSTVQYATFAANSVVSPSIQSVGTGIACPGSTSHRYQPAIAVTPTSSANPAPVVRVAFFYGFQKASGTLCAFSQFFRLDVYEKTTGNWSFPNPLVSTFSVINSSATSLTMATNRSTGDSYVAASYTLAGVRTTKLFYRDAWKNALWHSTQILSRESLIDVAAQGCGKFRIAVSDFTSGNGTYGPTWYRTGLWTGQTTPSWVEPSGVQVSSFARDPQALLWTGHFGLASNRDVHAVYDEQSGGSYFVRHDAYVFSGQQLPDCRLRDLDERHGVIGLGGAIRTLGGAGLATLGARKPEPTYCTTTAVNVTSS